VRAIQEPNIEIVQARIHSLNWPSARMDRSLLGLALKLTIVKKTQAWAQVSQHSSGLMHSRWKRSRCPRLVVVLEKAGGLMLKLFVCPEMIAHGPGRSASK